jgi:3-phosphoshikimate 1-carboxyvinyltransferase
MKEEHPDSTHRESEPWPAPLATRPVNAAISLTGSKSISNRALILAALSDSPTQIRSLLDARDTQLMMAGLRALGVEIDTSGRDSAGNIHIQVTPHYLQGPAEINVGLAGTVMRFLPPVAALARGDIYFDGDAGARKRPIATLLEALKDLGVSIEDRGRLPFLIHGTGHVLGGEVVLDASKSSQFVSALLLSAARCESGATIRHVPADLSHRTAVPSLPHVHMSVAMLAQHGVSVHQSDDSIWRVDPQEIQSVDVNIEGDLSNATPFFAAAIATGGTVTCPDWPSNSLQPVNAVLHVLSELGGIITRDGTTCTVTGPSEIQGISANLSAIGEITPTIVALCALAQSPSVITGIGHLRGHETDRLAALATEINALGGNVIEGADQLNIFPAPLSGGIFHTYEDHRMATAGAIIGLQVSGIKVENVDTANKTLPDFPRRWLEMLQQ